MPRCRGAERAEALAAPSGRQPPQGGACMTGMETVMRSGEAWELRIARMGAGLARPIRPGRVSRQNC